jgi:hypothetical protein
MGVINCKIKRSSDKNEWRRIKPQPSSVYAIVTRTTPETTTSTSRSSSSSPRQEVNKPIRRVLPQVARWTISCESLLVSKKPTRYTNSLDEEALYLAALIRRHDMNRSSASLGSRHHRLPVYWTWNAPQHMYTRNAHLQKRYNERQIARQLYGMGYEQLAAFFLQRPQCPRVTEVDINYYVYSTTRHAYFMALQRKKTLPRKCLITMWALGEFDETVHDHNERKHASDRLFGFHRRYQHQRVYVLTSTSLQRVIPSWSLHLPSHQRLQIGLVHYLFYLLIAQIPFIDIPNDVDEGALAQALLGQPTSRPYLNQPLVCDILPQEAVVEMNNQAIHPTFTLWHLVCTMLGDDTASDYYPFLLHIGCHAMTNAQMRSHIHNKRLTTLVYEMDPNGYVLDVPAICPHVTDFNIEKEVDHRCVIIPPTHDDINGKVYAATYRPRSDDGDGSSKSRTERSSLMVMMEEQRISKRYSVKKISLLTELSLVTICLLLHNLAFMMAWCM